jgi:protein ImuA
MNMYCRPMGTLAPLKPRHQGGQHNSVRLLGEFGLALGRVHEFCGPARRTLALLAAGACEGEIFWIRPSWEAETLHGDGMAPFVEPGRLIFVIPRRAEDLLWCAEEALRSGTVPFVVIDLPAPPALTPIRRLNLAAEAGGVHRQSPLGLVLTPEGDAAGVETRWKLDQLEGGWRLEQRKARTAPPRAWNLSNTDLRLSPAG